MKDPVGNGGEDMMEIKPIHSNEDYEEALERAALLMNSVDEEEGKELDILATLIVAYEEEHFPIEAPDPIEAIKYRMEQMSGLPHTI